MKKNNKINKYLIYITSFCFIFSFLFSLNFDNYSENQQNIFNDVYAAKAAQGAAGNASGGNNVASPTSYDVDDDTYLNLPSMVFAIVRFFSWLITFCASLIEWTLQPAFMTGLMENTAVKTGWTTVRDFLNIFFIFFLLFSAFATIFQVSKYHIKSTWVMIVVMALMVNFSWPIGRVIIDISNVTMTYIMGDTKSGGLSSALGKNSHFAALVVGQEGPEVKFDSEVDWVPIFMGVLTSFLFLVTIGAIALILVIRGIVLAVLMVFASVGFVLAAFPSTRSYANSWWSSLVKYAMIGPILLFMLILSINMLSAAESSNFVSSAPGSTGKTGDAIKELMKYTISLIVLWSGIIAAGKLGDGASSMVVGKAGAAVRGMGNKLKKSGVSTGKFVGRTGANTADSISGGRISSGIAKVHGVSDGWKKRFNNAEEGRKKRYNETKENMSARTEALAHDKGGIDGYGANKNAITAHENKKVAEMKKKHKEDNTDAVTLANELDGADKVKTRAIIESLSGMKEGVDENVIKKMVKSGDKIKGNKVLEKAITKKAAETGNSHVVYDNELNTQYKMKAKSAGKDISQLNSMERKTVKSNVSKDVYSGMDGKTFAKQKETIKRIDENNAGFLAIGEDLQGKLERASFAKEMQNVDSETYERLQNINDTHL
ncbi:MAG: type IV secretion system protein [Candidatus Moraniibacteriota bacterium]